jgi:geranylgeranylglycerol-phosphate geranylgeranyltransferase
MAAIGVWVGGYLSGNSGYEMAVFLGSLAAAFVCGAGNSMNDFIDIENDRINHRRRPLVTGDLPLYSAIVTSGILVVASVVISVFVNLYVFIIVAFSLILLAAYNFSFKKLPLWGNLSISLLGGLTFIVGGFAAEYNEILTPPGPVVPAVFAVLFHLGREFVKDRADIEGDKKTGFRTIAMVLGEKGLLTVTSFVYLILISVTIVPIFQNWYTWYYAIIAIILVNLPLLFILFYLWFSKSEFKYKKAGSWLKILMILGLAAFIAGKN